MSPGGLNSVGWVLDGAGGVVSDPLVPDPPVAVVGTELLVVVDVVDLDVVDVLVGWPLLPQPAASIAVAARTARPSRGTVGMAPTLGTGPQAPGQRKASVW